MLLFLLQGVRQHRPSEEVCWEARTHAAVAPSYPGKEVMG
jgi:hypothetical protein